MEKQQESVTITLKHYNELRMLSEANARVVVRDFMGSCWYGTPEKTAELIAQGRYTVEKAQEDYNRLYWGIKAFNDKPWWKRLFSACRIDNTP